MVSKYGLDVVFKFVIFAAIVLVVDFAFVDGRFARYAIIGFVGLSTIFVLNFFRDPKRTSPTDANVIVSPADGKVVLIKELTEPEYLKQDAVQLSIFMSPLNVHVNRIPISGTVGYLRYVPGDYIVAFDDKASERNERSYVGVEQNGYKVLLKQIAGTIARRIVTDVRKGQQVKAGERFGMIKFGSRVDVIMPKDIVIAVNLNDRVVAGETILAQRPSLTS